MSDAQSTPDFTVGQYRERILRMLRPLSATVCPLSDCLGMVTGQDVTAPIDLPRFDNSQMDGYAVRAADIIGAATDTPVSLTVVADIAAGADPDRSVDSGMAMRIMTGAALPAGADVVPREATDDGREVVRVFEALPEGRFVRRAGVDVRGGEIVLPVGTRIGARHIGLLASLGIAKLHVTQRPRVAVIATGRELRTAGSTLGPSEIFDGNSPMLRAALYEAGAEAISVDIQPDNVEVFSATLAEVTREADLIVTIGGISMGDHDVVKAALRHTVQFCRVRMQPGQPQGFGEVNGVPILCLPGNPVSAFVSFEVFVRPALAALTRQHEADDLRLSAVLSQDITSPSGKQQYLRGRLRADSSGLLVDPVGGPGSHLIGGLANADALIVIPESETAVAAGTRVTVINLER